MFALTLSLVSTGRADPIDDLLKKLPETTNALVVVYADAAFKSPLAVSEGWAAKHQEEYTAGTASLPPDIPLAVLGTEVTADSLRARWELTLVQSRKDYSLTAIAKRSGGAMDEVNGQPVVKSARNAYVVALGNQQYAIWQPAIRQDLVRWLRQSKSASAPRLSPYLMDAAKEASLATQIVMALDLTDSISSEGVRRYLDGNPALENLKVDRRALQNLMAGIKGGVFRVRIENEIRVELRVDFSSSPRGFEKAVQALVNDAAERVGLGLEGLDQWSANASGNAVVLSATINRTMLKRILSLAQHSAGEMESAANTESGGGSPGDFAKSTQRYYKEVKSLIDDLRKISNTERSYITSAEWHERYARKIDQLPLLYVDDEMVKYGAVIADKMRAIALSMRGVPFDINTIEQSRYATMYVSPGSAGYVGGWGWGGAYAYGPAMWQGNNNIEVNQQQAQVTADARKVRNQFWMQIDQATADIRRAMTAKYQVEF